ncbi:hypothetical protein GCM10009740_18720 [Terrabacter terrae]|uniref:Uncharacterized protein n=1 Tax=Terrabacter terrae TaxID=318434 RepID=A0ABP5FLP2_9MICO
MTRHAAYVFDLDGAVRDFGPGDAAPAIEAALGLPAGHVSTTAFRSDLLLPTITGRQGFVFDAVLNSADFGVVKPDSRAYTAAHAVIEADVGRELGRGEVWFTDDRAENVTAAREFAWHAELFTLGRKWALPGA